MELSRSSGILLHPTSLPSSRLGDGAYRFVDWLAKAGQSWWQVLPLGPPDETGSPYQARSAFAGWNGLLAEPRAAVSTEEIEELLGLQGYWLADWVRYAGLGALAAQVRFEREWLAIRRYANERGIGLIGDLPIYVAHKSADYAGRPELFQRGQVAGVPPDLFTAAGQLWGNPLYDWAALRRQGYRWWSERLRRTFELFDLAPRPLPRVRRVLVCAGPSEECTPWTLAARAGPRALRRGGRGAGRSPADRRESRRDHACRRTPPPGARLPRHARPPVRIRRLAHEPAPAPEP